MPATAPPAALVLLPPPPPLAHISIRLPPFRVRSPFIWFQKVEAQFLLANISIQLMRYQHFVARLLPKIPLEISSVISHTSVQGPHDHLKNAILQRTTLSKRKQLLRAAEELGDHTPLQLLTCIYASTSR